MPCILNYSSLKEKKHCPEAPEPHGAFHLSSLLYEAAELCEVNNEADPQPVAKALHLIGSGGSFLFCRDLAVGHCGNSLSWHMPLSPTLHAAMLPLSCIL